MADERVDPYGAPGPFSLDHIARYFWIGPLVAGKHVLDAACGTGFGAHMLATRNDAQVLAVDRDAPTIARANQRYAHPRIEFKVVDLAQPTDALPAGFDCIVCFETLEHLAQPGLLVEWMAELLKPDGLFIASVPGERDAGRGNPYHLSHFDENGLIRLVEGIFSHKYLFYQDFNFASVISPQRATAEVAAAKIEAGAKPDLTASQLCTHNLRLAASPGAPDTRLVIASRQPLEHLPEPAILHSADVWQAMQADWDAQQRYSVELQQRSDALGTQFKELEQKFQEVLAWGRYYHAQATGQQSGGSGEQVNP